MKTLNTLLILAFFIQACNPFGGCEIEITKEYIINECWDEYNNEVLIERMILVDTANITKSNIELISDDFRYLQVDSAFRYNYVGTAFNSKKPLLKKKIYFNQDNGWFWNFGSPYNNYEETDKKKIGNLKTDTWYRFSGIGSVTYHYVYVDKVGEVHDFVQRLSAY